ncbi:NAD(P)/FAD-dependent oxidoreductase [Aneurinibacillus sp. REN35]|uniref:NAD(P)/FAD-dependent oxidoreductase n=1 Tax=Aneurinibacillus sp. REN35 TaxID=3237286 RepID=UPI003529958D
MDADLVVVGAGAAGLSAAARTAAYGAQVVVVDENPYAGGKLPGQLHESPGHGWWKGGEIANRLREEVESAGGRIIQEREVWGISPGFHVLLNYQEELRAPYILLATGALERPIPMPGWTLPGVMAVGAAQVMTNIHRVLPGKKVLIVGIDVLSMTIARQLKMAGAEVVGLVLPPSGIFSGEKANPVSQISLLAGMADLAPTTLLRLAGRAASTPVMHRLGAALYPAKGMRVWEIPLMLRKAALEIRGRQAVESVVLADVTSKGEIIENSRHEVAVDCVCISGGLAPLGELASSIGCTFTHIPELGGHVPLHSPLLETDRENVFVAGNITGIEGANVAMAQGELAGTAIAAKLGLLGQKKEAKLMEAQHNVNITRERADIQFMPNILKGREAMEAAWNEMFLHSSMT